MATSPPTFWVRLYAVERAHELHFVYGYAVSVDSLPSKWGRSEVFNKGSSWRLIGFNCFIAETDLLNLANNTSTGVISISAGKNMFDLKIDSLKRRPKVYAYPRTFATSGSPLSFSEELAEFESWWELSKNNLCGKIFPSADFSDAEVTSSINELLGNLQEDTGILFLSDEAGRFGNLEIVRYLSGDVRKPDGLCSLVAKPTTGHTSPNPSLHVWIEPPLANAGGALLVNCTLFNGGGFEGTTCILDETRTYQLGDVLRFSPDEPPSEYEISVWRDHKLVAHQHQNLLRTVATNFTISGASHRVITNWSKGLPEHLRKRAELVQSNFTQKSVVGETANDPWRSVEYAARSFVDSGFSNEMKGRFFQQAAESNLEAVEFIAELILRTNVQRVVIADPYFDNIGVESLLIRIKSAKEVIVLTSHPAETAGKTNLITSCEAGRDVLPSTISILNVQGPNQTGQQFHDRYILIESENDEKAPIVEVWALSNSFSSLGRFYPLVAVMLPPNVAIEVAKYLKGIENGRVYGRQAASVALLWGKRVSSAASHSPSLHLPDVPPFPWAMRIGRILVPSQPRRYQECWHILASTVQRLLGFREAVAEAETRWETDWHETRIRESVESGLLTAAAPEINWAVPASGLSQVLARVRAAISTGNENNSLTLRALAHWAYHGGPSASEYDFDSGTTRQIGVVLREHLEPDTETGLPIYGFEPLQQHFDLPSSLAAIWHTYDQLPFGTHARCTPEVYFYAEVLWSIAPDLFIKIWEETQSFSLLCWLCAYGRTKDERKLALLLDSNLGIAQAIGVIFLRDIVKGGPNLTDAEFQELAKKLSETKLTKSQLFLTLVFIAAKRTSPIKSVPSSFAICSPFWTELAGANDDLTRVIGSIASAAPNRAIPRTVELADDCPIVSDAIALRTWCVNALTACFPLKNGHESEKNIPVLLDELTLKLAARAAWSLHGLTTSSWFQDSVIRKLDYGDVIEPLIRIRNYSRWHTGVKGMLFVIKFAIAIVENAPTSSDRLASQGFLAPLIVDALKKLGMETFLHYSDFEGHLLEITAYIGRSTDQKLIDKIEKEILTEEISTLWKLWIVLQSAELYGRVESQMHIMTSAPSTPARARSQDGIEGWYRRLISASQSLAQANLKHKSSLSILEINLGKWRDHLLTS